MQIPQIIHQVWEGKTTPLPDFLCKLGKSWRDKNPDWEYVYWDKARMDSFVHEYYPFYMDIYNKFPYDVMRWDVIRYMILYKIGGLYVDFDYECLEPIEPILGEWNCCLGLEPQQHGDLFNRKQVLGNALMASVAKNSFFLNVLEYIFSQKESDISNRFFYVLNTTGPFMLTDVYDLYYDKENIYLIPEEYVSPFTKNDVMLYMNDLVDEDVLDKKLDKAVAVHYFFGTWY